MASDIRDAPPRHARMASCEERVQFRTVDPWRRPAPRSLALPRQTASLEQRIVHRVSSA